MLRGPAQARRPVQTGVMISTRLARALREAGLVWTPVSGDAFQQMSLSSVLIMSFAARSCARL